MFSSDEIKHVAKILIPIFKMFKEIQFVKSFLYDL